MNGFLASERGRGAARAIAPIRPIRGRRLAAVAVGCGLVALAVRLALSVYRTPFAFDGLFSIGNYDDGVYFSSAIAFVNGRMPYRDFLFLQPPGITVLLAPFGALAALVGDANAFATARLAFLALGGLNAALVVVAMRRYGLVAASAAGLLWALFLPAAYAERSTLLEGVGNTLLLAALVASAPAAPTRAAKGRWLLAGLALGVAVTVKLWIVVPLLVLASFRRAARGRILAGAAVGIAVVCLPFALAAPRAFAEQVVLDQLGRPRISGSLGKRLWEIFHPPSAGPILGAIAVAAAIAAILAICLVGWRRIPDVRLLGTLCVLDIVVLCAAPSFYRHYAAFASVPIVLLAGIGVRLLQRQDGGAVRTLSASIAAGVIVVAAAVAWATPGRGLRSKDLPSGLEAAIGSVSGCVTTDTPAALVLTNSLSAMLARGCPFWADFSGWQYAATVQERRNGVLVSPLDNQRWQATALGYLRSGDAILLTRDDQLSPASVRELRAAGILFHSASTPSDHWATLLRASR